MKHLARRSALEALVLLSVWPFAAGGVLLDCEINADRVYTCIEVGDVSATAGNTESTDSYSDEYGRYVEEAKQSCVYKEPRRRTPGKTTGAALRSEQLKTARADYDKCVTDTARNLWLRSRSEDETN